MLSAKSLAQFWKKPYKSYKPAIVHELKGESKQDAEQSLKTIKKWFKEWKNK